MKRLHKHCGYRVLCRMRWLIGGTLLVIGCFLIKDSSVLVAKTTEAAQSTPSKNVAKPVPPTFGKSHFIVGMPAEETARLCAAHSTESTEDTVVNAYDMVCMGVFPQALFCPHDDVCKMLVHLIQREQKSIKFAAYAVTEPRVAKALCAAVDRGVSVSLVVDRSCLDMTGNKLKLLQKKGVKVLVFDGKTREDGALMHNKFFLFEENIKNKRLVWTGSANTTKSGYARNHENVLIVDEPHLFVRYTKEFTLLMTLAEKLVS